MKNFLDLLAIDAGIDIDIRLAGIVDNGTPRCQVKINDTVLLDRLLDTACDIHYRVGLSDSIHIEISMSGKIYSAEKESAIVIESIKIDGMDLIPRFIHLCRYDNDHDADGPTSYLGFNGTWILDISEPFYRWRHKETGQGWLLDPIT